MPGVVGVFWGLPVRGGRLGRNPCLVVHVRTKLPSAEVPDPHRIRRRVAEICTDVVAVGRPRLQVLDHTDKTFATTARWGTISSVAQVNGGALLLLSGHASLPESGGRILRSYATSLHGPATVEVRDADIQTFTAELIEGTFGGPTDWAVAKVSASPSELSTYHLSAGGSVPLPIRRALPLAGETVHQRSHRGGLVHGTVAHGLSSVTLDVPDGTEVTFDDVLSVMGVSGAFSVDGDSGSIVVDDSGQVVGFVVGGAANGAVSYVLPIGPTRNQLGNYLVHFFT